MAPLTPPRSYRFGPYRLDLDTSRLFKDGASLPLPPKTFDTLLVLVRHAGRLVEKGELMRTLWPDTFVEESNLAQQVFTLRRVLGDQPDGRPYIETMPRRGYVFAAPVIEGDDAPVEASWGSARQPPARSGLARRRTVAVLALAAACLAGVLYGFGLLGSGDRALTAPSVAVLPFRELIETDGRAPHAHLGLGMTDALITRLGSLGRIVVRPTGSVLPYADVADPVAAGRRLGTSFLVDGRIQHAAGRVRVTVQLLRVSDGVSVWASTFDEPYTDIFGVQDAIAERVAEAVVPNLSPADRKRVTRRYTDSTRAYRWYVLGRYHWNQRTDADLKRSIEYFERAIAEDANYALAHAGLADAYNILGNFSVLSPRVAFPRAKDASRRALDLDPELAEAQVAHVFSRFLFDYDWAGTEAGFARALAMNETYAPAHQWYGVYLAAAGRTEEAIRAVRRAAQLDPLSLVIHSVLAWTLYTAGHYDEAHAQAQATLALNPEFPLAYLYLGQIHVQQRRYDEAIDALRRARGVPGGSVRAEAELAHAYALAGRPKEARELLRDLTRRSATEYVEPFYVALILTGLGERDAALAMLARAYDERFPWMVRLRVDPRLAPLRSDPRFEALTKRIGIPG